MQRIFKCGNIQHTSRIPEKELDILIDKTPFCIIIHWSYTFTNTPVFFLAQSVYIHILFTNAFFSACPLIFHDEFNKCSGETDERPGIGVTEREVIGVIIELSGATRVSM